MNRWRVTRLVVAGLGVAVLLPTPGSAGSGGGVVLHAPRSRVPQGQVATLLAQTSTGPQCRLRTTSPSGRKGSHRLRLPAAANVVTFTVSADARRGPWRMTLTCGAESASARLRVNGVVGRRTAQLFARETLASRAVDEGKLDSNGIPSELETVGGKDTGGPDPDFRIPFPCNQTWEASTYPGHGYGIDWNASGNDTGRAVTASADGVAHRLPFGGHNGGYGNAIVLVHGGGWTTVYAHLRTYLVRSGELVTRGELIGRVGRTGNATGPHLHYEQRFGGVPRPARASAGLVRAATYRSDNCGAPPVAAALLPLPPPPPSARRVIRVDNRVTNGLGMQEDSVPLRLTTEPRIYCGTRGCNINGTERATGGTYDAAICQTLGERFTNGNDADPTDDNNPELFESRRYYGVQLVDGTFGYVSEVWLRSADRGGLGLGAC